MWDVILSFLERRPRTVIGLIIGFIIGLLLVTLHFWKTVLVIVCVTIGYCIGKYLDTRKDWGEILDRLFTQKP
ncbi:MAG: DUF2273 domain-containing protein [bacterium]|nr:DUF2273 domain-containing protein [bacterium]